MCLKLSDYFLILLLLFINVPYLQVSLLDPKRSMNVGIFLRQFKM